MNIRKAKMSDALAILTLNEIELGYPFDEALMKKQLEQLLESKKDLILVATIKDMVVGYIHAANYEPTYSEPMKNIMGIAVDHTFQRLGIGRALLQEVEAWALAESCCGVRLVSGKHRQKAHIFYQSCGYSKEKLQVNFKKQVNENLKNY